MYYLLSNRNAGGVSLKIFHKLIAGYMVIVGLIWLLGYVSMQTSKDALQSSIVKNTESEARHMFDEIEQQISNRIDVFDAFQKDIMFQRIVQASNQAFARMADRQSYIQHHDQAWVSTPKDSMTPFMQRIQDNALSAGLRRKIQYYQQKYGYRIYGEVFVTNRYGVNVAQSGRTSDFRQDDERWWQQAKVHGLYVSDVHFDESAGIYSIDVAMRVVDTQGNFAGVMKLVLNIKDVFNLIKAPVHEGNTGDASSNILKLADSTGHIVFSSRDADIFTRNEFVAEQYKQPETGVISGHNKDVFFVRIQSQANPDFPSPVWTMIIECSLQDVFAPITRMKHHIFAAILIVSLVALLLALFVSRSIAGPIKCLTDYTDHIDPAHMDDPIPVHGEDEVGRLVAAFNTMMQRLNETTVSRDALLAEIDGREKAELEQQESEKQYQGLFEDALDMIHIVGRDGCIMAANPIELEKMGYSRQEFLGKPLKELIHPDCQGESRARIDIARSGQSIEHFETIMLSKDGRKITVEGSIVPKKNALGQVVSVRTIFRDISERKQMIASLNEARALLESLLDSVPDLIFYKDKNSVYLGCNQAFFEFVGKSAPRDVIGISDFDMFDAELADFFREKDRAMLSKGEAQRNEEWVTYPDGRKVLLDTLKTPYFNKKGEVIGLIGVSRDITAFKALEDQFVQAQKMEAVGTLVGGIAHDFNNMLGGITGNIFLARKDVASNSQALKRLDNMEQIAFRASDMIQQLLTFARKDVVSMQSIPLNSFIKRTFKLLRTTTPENITLRQDISRHAMRINGDETQLNQILINLINNACDALAERDEPTITFRLEDVGAEDTLLQKHVHVEQERYAHLSIEDNGCGITKAKIKHLFEPFFTTKEVGKGTGLGLAMVFGAIERHQGFIDVQSAPNQGTTFHIYLPLLDTGVSDVPTAAVEAAEGHGEVILLADDQIQIIETGKEVLETLGYRVLTASDGQQAVDIFKAHPDNIDLCIFDVVMPVMSGDVAATMIRDINPHAKIIFSTGYDQHLLSETDGEVVINKPFQISELSQLIRLMLGA